MAACAGCDPDLFHHRVGQRAALCCCAACPAAGACLSTALVYEESAGYRFGVWEATTAYRRKLITADLARRGLNVAELVGLEQSRRAESLGERGGASKVAAR